jgi:hypothetical protein
MTDLRLNSPNVTTFTASIGDIIKITRPVGYPAYAPGKAPANPPSGDYEAYGFKILDQNLGRFIRLKETKLKSGFVYYEHLKSGRQIIRYKAQTLTKILFYIIVQGIQIHDHASIYQGGPAFATYYAELPADTAEEE